ncbi:hypothetical protein DSM107003_40670 [Trichormus variabilis SAG 1403-4b]|uniref:Uncharacterized protein n=1 Tax=Trichormus variabilis SAG 1403-4b TaxID=447716 RepID=A0A433UJ09_ANAVA|nr:hypothetical protein DSM107003_40670 [Trichormus variabilis SAG 1403-4b]
MLILQLIIIVVVIQLPKFDVIGLVLVEIGTDIIMAGIIDVVIIETIDDIIRPFAQINHTVETLYARSLHPFSMDFTSSYIDVSHQ